jgi:hypothetical protein
VSWWIRFADAAVIILLLLAARVYVDGAIELEFRGRPVTAGSTLRPLLLAAIVAAFRHWQQPRPWLGVRIADGLRRWRTEPWATIARAFVVSRFGVLLVGVLAVLTFGVPPGALSRSKNPVLDLPDRWDAGWYVGIARNGYGYDPQVEDDRQQSIAFFPAYPVIIRLLSTLTRPHPQVTMSVEEFADLRRGRVMWTATAISLAFFLAALVVFYRWAEARAEPQAASGAMLLLAAYPFAVFFSAPYTESMFLFGSVAAFLAFERERWFLAAAAGLLVGLTRPNGAMLSVPLAILALGPLLTRQTGWPRRTAIGLAVASAAGVGMLVHSAYIYSLTGDAFAWMAIQQAWGRSPQNSAGQLQSMYDTLRNEGFLGYLYALPIQFVQTAATLFALLLVWPVWRRIGAAYAVFVLANLLPPLITGGVLSMGRMTSTMFPLFLALALLVTPGRRPAWLLGFGILQGLLAALFFTWRPVF